MTLTSDPHAWLRPYYVALKADGGLQKLAIPLQFEALCCAVEAEHPSRAASMREWSHTAKEGIFNMPSGLDLRLMLGDEFHLKGGPPDEFKTKSVQLGMEQSTGGAAFQQRDRSSDLHFA